MPEPLELATITQRTAAARQAFARDVDELLEVIRRAMAEAVAGNHRRRDELLWTIRAFVLEKFEQRLPLPAPADPLGLQQLVREAYDVLHNPESHVDVRDWLHAAEPFVRS